MAPAMDTPWEMEPRLPDRRGDDPAADDWLAEEGGVDWSGEESPPRRSGRPPSTPRADEPDSGGLSRYDPRQLTDVQRRRLVALGVLLALLLVGIVAAVALLGSDDEPTATTTSPPATQPPATTPATTAPAATPLTVTLPASGPLSLGASGEEVETLQTALAALEFDPGEVDGEFGAGTDEAVRAFQQANALPADGVVGEATVEKLNAVLAAEGVTDSP